MRCSECEAPPEVLYNVKCLLDTVSTVGRATARGAQTRGRAARLLAVIGVSVSIEGCQLIAGIQTWTETHGSGVGGATTSGSTAQVTSASASTSSGTTTGSTASSASSSTATGCVACAGCFGSCACDGTCVARTISIAGAPSVVRVSVSASNIAVSANVAATGSVYRVSKLNPGTTVGSPLWTGSTVDALAAADAAFVASGHSIVRAEWMGGATSTLATDPSISPSRMTVATLVNQSARVWYLYGIGGPGGGGIYWLPTSGASTPSKLGSLDFPVGLAVDSAHFYSLVQGHSASSVDGTGLVSFLLTMPDGSDLAVDTSQLYTVRASDGVVFTAPLGGTTASQRTTTLQGAVRAKISGAQLYLQSPTKIVRADTATLGAPVIIVTEAAGTITDFDVDTDGVYWGVDGVGLKMLSL